MKPTSIRLLFLSSFLHFGCTQQSAQQLTRDITVPVTKVVGVDSALVAPSACPVYAPGGGDVDTAEAPFPPQIHVACAVDSLGGTYGIVTGDARTASMAVIAGEREVGVYFDVEPQFASLLDAMRGGTEGSTITAFVAPVNVDDPTDCCAEAHADARHAVQIAAIGPSGVLVSLGQFDASPTQVSLDFPISADPSEWARYGARFYVNGAPKK